MREIVREEGISCLGEVCWNCFPGALRQVRRMLLIIFDSDNDLEILLAAIAAPPTLAKI